MLISVDSESTYVHSETWTQRTDLNKHIQFDTYLIVIDRRKSRQMLTVGEVVKNVKRSQAERNFTTKMAYLYN